ncbi:MAG: DEAD/DEAH box helicase [Candidatus Levyibacteriota bacterium]
MYRDRNNYHRRRFSRSKDQSQRLDSRLFVNKAQDQAPKEPDIIRHQFSDFLISDQLKTNIKNKGYETPTPIQDKVIPLILENKDIIGVANTGTGKTGAFLIPLINKAFFNRSEKTLIVTPTRELAVQIEQELRDFAMGMAMYTVLCIGGMDIYGQTSRLQKPHNFVIGTPGRIKDLEKQGKLRLHLYNNIVLDEVDRMLDIGFMPDVKFIISRLSPNRQSFFFSATLPQSLAPLVQSFLKNPVTISVKSQETASGIDQEVIKIAGRAKIEVLHDLLIKEGFEKVLVFGRTKWGMEKLSRSLTDRGFKVAAIHGNKNQNQRLRAIKMFKSNEIQVLLATDIASRGLDIEDVTHVINFDQPASYDDYVHRIGRTGRANKKGSAITFVD